MAKITQQGSITAWSFSRLQAYRKCPKYAYFLHVAKLKEPGNKAMQRGSDIDKDATEYLMGRAKTLRSELHTFKTEFDTLRKLPGLKTQEQWAFTTQWSETGWFDGDAWLRIKTDFYRLNPKTKVLLLVDLKTGQERAEHSEQLDLYAMGGLLKMPEAKAVDVRLWYSDSGVKAPREEKLYTPADLPKLKTYWLAQVKSMLADRQFKEKPSYACSYCFFSKAKGGPCSF